MLLRMEIYKICLLLLIVPNNRVTCDFSPLITLLDTLLRGMYEIDPSFTIVFDTESGKTRGKFVISRYYYGVVVLF